MGRWTKIITVFNLATQICCGTWFGYCLFFRGGAGMFWHDLFWLAWCVTWGCGAGFRLWLYARKLRPTPAKPVPINDLKKLFDAPGDGAVLFDGEGKWRAES